jgi:hypothetical protein
MADNPFRGQAGYESYEQAWDWGYKYGFDNPHVSDYQSVAKSLDYWPGPLYDDQQRDYMKQQWAEAALAGQADGLQQGHPVTVTTPHAEAEHPSGTEAAVHVLGHGAAEAGATVVEAVEAGTALETLTVAGVAGAFAEGVFVGAILFLITGGGLTWPEEPMGPEELGKFLAEKCTEAGCPEFYLPYCTATGHQGGSDSIFQAGFWHGPLYYNEANSFGDAKQHVINERHWGHTGVLHYMSVEPTRMDWMVLTHQ